MSSYCHCTVALPRGAIGWFTGWQSVIVVLIITKIVLLAPSTKNGFNTTVQ